MQPPVPGVGDFGLQVLFVTVLRWVQRHMLSLVLIIAVLVLGKIVWAHREAFQALRDELTQLVPDEQRMTGELDTMAKIISARANAMRSASLQQLETQVAAVDREIAPTRAPRPRLGPR